MHILNVLLIPSFMGLASAWINTQICHAADPKWGTPGNCNPQDLAWCRSGGPCGYCPGKTFQSGWSNPNGGCDCYCA
ncbi:hypothetical protein PtrV1_10660 [Pyrenophora tritici-repentis]|nr:hypothetical protein PtrV1_10660 [Pyrenophora tritici-repentis]KAF7444142.1 hypothetical protein A1F99_122160 [Pyrenophora tritici-repentis]